MKQNKNKPDNKSNSAVEARVIQKLAEISRDILSINVDTNKSIKDNYKRFYKIMGKYGITKYTKTKTGYSGNNFEWTICEVLFEYRLQSSITIGRILSTVPRKIMY